MKILLVVHTFFPHWRAGTEVYTLNLARGLRQRGHEIQLVCYEPREDAGAELEAVDEQYEGFPTHRILFNKSHPDQLLHEYFNPQVEEHLVNFFGHVRPDVIHVVHTMHLSAATLTAAQRLALPLICTAMDFWYLCPTFRLLRKDSSVCSGPVNFLQCILCYALRVGKWRRRLVATLAPSDFVARILRRAIQTLVVVPGLRSLTTLRKLWHVVERPQRLREILSKVDVLIVPSQNTYNIFVQNGIIARRMMLLGFGLVLPAELHIHKKPSERLRLGYIGTLDHAKGVHVLLEAIQRLANQEALELTVYGDPRHHPDYYVRLQKLAGSDRRIKFAGTFPNEQIGQVLSEIDLLAIPSLWHENTPLVLYSAFATKTPVLVSNIGSLADAVHHGENGLVFEMGNSEDLARQIERVLTDRALLEKLRQGIQPVKTMDQNVQELLEIYAALSSHSGVVEPKMEAASLSKWLQAVRSSSSAVETRLSPFKRTALSSGLRFRAARFDDWLELCRYESVYEFPRQMNLRLAWRCARLPDRTLAVFVHFLNKQNVISFQADHLFKDVLGRGEAQAEELVAYSVPIRVPDEVPPGSYGVRLGVWVPSEERFLVPTRVRGWRRDPWHGIRLGRIRVR